MYFYHDYFDRIFNTNEIPILYLTTECAALCQKRNKGGMKLKDKHETIITENQLYLLNLMEEDIVQSNHLPSLFKVLSRYSLN